MTSGDGAIEYAGRTHPGRIRDTNEDAIAHWPHGGGLLFAVADGVGGERAGEVASALVLEVLGREMEEAPGSWPVAKRLRRSVYEANLALHSKSIAVPELRGMCTTLTASAIVDGVLVAAHVGDCRLLVVRDRQARQLTKDHTWIAEQLRLGRLTPEAVRTHPQRHVITRCLGRDLVPGVDLVRFELRAGDIVAQMSDGVHALLGEEEISAILNALAPQAACDELVRRGLEEGGPDNLSVQIATVRQCAPARPRSWWPFGR